MKLLITLKPIKFEPIGAITCFDSEKFLLAVFSNLIFIILFMHVAEFSSNLLFVELLCCLFSHLRRFLIKSGQKWGVKGGRKWEQLVIQSSP